MTEIRTEYDSAWKEVLERFLEEFILFCFPAIHAEIYSGTISTYGLDHDTTRET